MEYEETIEIIAKEKELTSLLNELASKMLEREEDDDGCFDGLDLAYDLVKARLKKLREPPKKEVEKINFWDIKKSIHEKNKENANCIKEFF